MEGKWLKKRKRECGRKIVEEKKEMWLEID